MIVEEKRTQIHDYLTGAMDEAKQQTFNHWLEQDEEAQQLFREEVQKFVRVEWAERWGQVNDMKAEEHWNDLKKTLKLDHQNKNTSKRILWLSTAAAFVIGIISTFLFYSKPTTTPTIQVAQSTSIKPGRPQATLLLENGEKLLLGETKDTCLILANQNKITISQAGELQYESVKGSKGEGMHTLSIPRGGEYKLALEDGTEIWLNSETKLKYPIHFSGKERRIILKGEAYLQVARNESQPFIVESGDMSIHVLGTSFNISNYTEDGKSLTTLIAGKVRIVMPDETKNITLQPGEQAIVEKGEISVKKVNTKLYSLWMKERFAFEKESIEQVIRKLSRWYNVSFTFADSKIKEKRFTGSIPKYSDISQVLKIIEMTTNIHFIIKDDMITIQ